MAEITMNAAPDKDFRRVMDGSDRSIRGVFLRGTASFAEPFYSGVMWVRNFFYDRKILAVKSLGRPAISVGNITTGGTGKTPVVQWLAERLMAMGEQPAVLLRGYKSNADGMSDEQVVLQAALNKGGAISIPVIANPDRVAGAAAALRKFPRTTVFVLDDAMQHRRAGRQFDLVLIHAAEPFGFNHVLPRGLLREPLCGLRRATAFLITHAGEASTGQLAEIETTLRRYQSSSPIFRCDHQVSGFRAADAGEDKIIPSLLGRRYVAFCGLGSPMSFFRQLEALDGDCAQTRAFDDHHDYTAADLAALRQMAMETSAEIMVTSEKDWAKISKIRRNSPGEIPIWRAELSLRFYTNHENSLFDLIRLTTYPDTEKAMKEKSGKEMEFKPHG